MPFVCYCKPRFQTVATKIDSVYPISVLVIAKTCLGQSVPPLLSGILSGQIQKAPPVYGSFYACYSYRYPQETPCPLPEWRQILGELSAAGGRADTVGSFGSVRKLSEVPTRSAGRGRSLWAFPAPLPSNYTPAPVGSLWGCCALCEPVGAVRKSRSACADLCRNLQLIAKKLAFSRVGEWFRLLISQKCRA